MQLLQQHYQVPSTLLCYCPFLLETQQAELPNREVRQHFIAIGNFRHAPNWHSVLWLKQLWPKIRAQLPTAELHIYGAYPPPKATALHNPATGFLVKGWAEDALDVMRQARVCLAPLAFGAGLKGKLLDAMRCGTPSVTTDIGAEGMTLEDRCWPGIVANSDDEIVKAAVALYQDESLWQYAKLKAVHIIAHKFSVNQHRERIWLRLEMVAKQLEEHRASHFTGVMLRHHAYRSTKFMGQWIETKTRLAELIQPD